MIRPPPRSTRTDTLFPYTTLFRSTAKARALQVGNGFRRRVHHPFLSDDIYSNDAERRESQIEHFRSEEHTSELQSLMRISYAVFCLKKKKKKNITRNTLTIKIQRRQNVYEYDQYEADKS